jgi:DNA primase
VTTAIDTMLGIVGKAHGGDNLRVDQLLLRMSETFGFTAERLERRLEQIRKASRSRESNRREIAAAKPHRVAPAIIRDPNAALAESADDEAYSMGLTHKTRIDAVVKPLEGIDRELFETLIEAPQLAAMAVEAIDPDWFESVTAKMLMSAYQDLELEGRALDLSNVLLLIENEHLKNQLVSCEQRVRQREGKVANSPEEQYAAILTRYREREQRIDASRKIRQLESTTLAEDAEDALLKELFDTEKTRHLPAKPD